MGQKIHPHGFRVGVNKTWSSQWFAEGEEYKQNLREDLQVRELIDEEMSSAGVSEITIKRAENKVDIELLVAKPGVAIGRGGSDIEKLNEAVEKIVDKNVNIRIKEVKKPDLSARIIARAIAEGLERRVPSKILMKSYRERIMSAGAKGMKIQVSGRIGGAIQARTVKVTEGQVPLHTLRAELDYAEEMAIVPNMCTFGVKVWINKDDKNDKKR